MSFVTKRHGNNAFIVGNGYIGTSAYSKSQLYVRYGRTVSVPINFYPVVSVDIDGYSYQGMYKSIDLV